MDITRHNRRLHCTKLPHEKGASGHGLNELTVRVEYVGNGGAMEGIALDHDILPLFAEAGKLLAACEAAVDEMESGRPVSQDTLDRMVASILRVRGKA